MSIMTGFNVTYLLLSRLRIAHAALLLLTAFLHRAAPKVPELGAEGLFVRLKRLALLCLLVSNNPVRFLVCRSVVLHELASLCTFSRLCVGRLGHAQLAAVAVVLQPCECAAEQTECFALQV